MIKKLFLLLMVLMAMILGCTKDDHSDDTWKNTLTFGTGLNPSNFFQLAGEGTIFSPGNVYFRLESKTDYEGYSVKFVVLRNGITHSTEIFSNNPKPTGHIFISGLNFSQTGTYDVTAYITSVSETLVAIGTFQIQ